MQDAQDVPFEHAPAEREGALLGVVRRPSASDLLETFAAGLKDERVTIGAVITMLQDRAFGILLLVFGLPNLFPTPIPGLSTVLAVPLVLIAAQLLWRPQRLWFPRWLEGRSLPSWPLKTFIRHAAPWLRRAEALLTPRLAAVASPLGERLAAILCVILAIAIALPIPFGNILPAIGISLIALGLFERDGVFILAGMTVGAAGLLWAGLLVAAGVKGVIYVLLNAL